MHAWCYLTVAILFEVGGTLSMKLSEGFTRPTPSALILLFYGLAFVALSFALKKIDVGVAYAVWSGAGTFLVAIIGFLCLNEALTAPKVFFLVLIITGVGGLYLVDGLH